MATGPVTTPKTHRSAPSDEGQCDRFIQQRLERAQFHVKLTDLISVVMELAAVVLVALLVLAVIDHWILPLSRWARWASLGLLLLGAGYYFAVALLPLLLGRISPAYAARAIEKSEPSLKNSLINFLMFRSDRAGLRAAIYQALKQQAATDLSRVEIETAVDRSRLIRTGYVLAAILAVCALYTIFSPRSAFQSMARAIAPWTDVPPPSRVRIENVRPGDREFFYGQTIPVSADCYDLYENEAVTVVYSTLDAQVSGRLLPMRPGEGGLRYHCSLPPGGEGIQQDVVYWIQAGDARTPAYRITVLPAPSILVERLGYVYPAYTGRAENVVERQGDIRGPEGTLLTVHARANQPIRSAMIEFDPTGSGVGRADQLRDRRDDGQLAPPAPEHIEMDCDGQRAWCSFVLQLNDARTRPQHASYHIRFTTEQGQRNPHPILHRIEVTPDLAPEVEILTPARDQLEIREDARQTIEIRALDPDYGLSRVALRAVAGGHDLLDRPLLNDRAGRAGQVVVTYGFQPAEHGLRAGDRVAYWAAADDNRTAPGTDEPAPNSSRTRTYHFTILPPEKPPAAEHTGRQDGSGPPNASSHPSSPNGPGSPDSQPIDEGHADAAENPDQTGATDGAPRGSQGDQPRRDASGTDSQDGSQTPNGGQTAGSQSAGDSSGTAEGQPDGTSPSGSSSESDSPSEPGNATESQGGGTGDRSGTTGAPSDGDGASEGGQSGGSSGDQRRAGGGGSEDSATAREPLHDGEVFETALEHMRQQQQNSAAGQDSAGQDSAGQDSAGQDSAGQDSAGQDSAGQDAAGQGSAGQDTSGQPSGGQSSDGGAERPSQGSTHDGSSNTQSSDGAGQSAESAPDARSGARPGGSGESSAESSQTGQSKQPQPGGQQSGGPRPQSGDQQPDGQQSQAGGQSERERQQDRSGSSSEGSQGSKAQPPQSGDEQGQARGSGQAEKRESSGSQPVGKPKQAGQGNNGQSASGQDSEDQSGAAGSPKQAQDRPKEGGSSSGQPKPGGGQQTPGQSQRQSDSRGSQSGDRSGGGGQGAGQGAKQQGNDGAGSSSGSTEDGGAASGESGAGDSANRPGDKVPSQGETGTPGTQKGWGPETDASAGDRRQGDAAGSRSAGAREQDKTGRPTAADAETRGKGLPLAGGMPSPAELGGLDMTGQVPPGEKPNLDYARKTTDLVLRYLKDQQQNPDPQLLQKLGWTKDELQQFVARWQALKRAAVEQQAARRDLVETLRSLGLRPRASRLRQTETRDDRSRALRTAGVRSEPPPRYAEQFDAYKKGTARTRD